jgi:hypothetical protein
MSRDSSTEGEAADLGLDFFVKEEHRARKIKHLGQEAWHRELYGDIELPEFKYLDEFLAEDDQDEQHVIPGAWAKDTPILFSAQYKAGKTTVRDNVVKVLADGGKLFGRFDCDPYPEGRIVILDLELAPHMMRGWLRAHGILKTDRVVVVPMRGKGASLNLTVPEVRAKWAAQLKAWEAGVVFLDCLRPVLDSLKLSENTEAGRFLNAGFDPLLREAGGLQGMVIQHMGHNGERARGDSSMLGWGDSWKLLRQNDDPNSKRFFTGFGRFGEIEESELDFNTTTRELTFIGGSRKESAKEHNLWIIRGFVYKNPGCSQAQVIHAFRNKPDQTDYEPLSDKTVREAIKHGLATGQLDPGFSPKGAAMQLTVVGPVVDPYEHRS